MGSSRRVAALAVALAAVAATGCGDSPEDSAGAAGEGRSISSFPVTVRDATGRVTVERRPTRIVSLSPSATETLFAIGAGDQVIAVDDESDHPAGVPTTDLSSYQPNVEAITDYRPDLVVVPSSVPRDVTAGLRRLGLAVLAQDAPDDLGGAYRQMHDLGTVTGHEEASRRLVERVRSRVEELIAKAPSGPSLKVFHELDPDLFTASSDTFIGLIYQRLGLENVADPAAKRSANPYPQMSSEAVVSADPDLVVLADTECCGQTPAEVARRAGWEAVAAVRGDAVVTIHDDVASRWGPRVPLFVERVVLAMEKARAAAAGEDE